MAYQFSSFMALVICMNKPYFFDGGGKTLGDKEKILVTCIFTSFHNAFRRPLSGSENQRLFFF